MQVILGRGSRIGLDIASPGNMLAQGKGQREDFQPTCRIKAGRVRVGEGLMNRETKAWV